MAALVMAAALALSPAAAADRAPRLITADGVEGAGRVFLQLAPAEPGDPEGSLRLQAVVQGPLQGDGAEDLYAFNAVLSWPAGRIEYVPGSVRRGELLGRDGRDWLITAAPASGARPELTVGGSRMGAVPGVAAPAGALPLFSVALQVSGSEPIALVWAEGAFIDSQVRALDVARFAGATLVPAEPPAPSGEEQP